MSQNIKQLIIIWMLGFGLIAWGGCDREQSDQETTVCPVMPDKTIVRKFFVDYEGERVYLCCEACVRLFKKRPERYMKKAQQLGIVYEDAPGDVAN